MLAMTTNLWMDVNAMFLPWPTSPEEEEEREEEEEGNVQQIYTQLGMVAITTKKIDVNAMIIPDPLRTKKK